VFRDLLPAAALVGNELADDPLALDAAFAALGRAAVDLPEVQMARRETGRGVLRWLEGNVWTWPGPTTSDERARATEGTTTWAASEGIDLDEPFATEAVNRWRSYRREPGGP